MPGLERENPNTPCQPNGAHHPHLLVCSDLDDDCWDDLGDGRGWMQYHELTCCVCNSEWPCDTKKRHTQERRRAHHLAEALSKIEHDGEPYFHEEPHMYGRVCVKLKEPDRLNRRWGTVYWEDGQGYTLSSGCIGPHNV